jgi:hypothetical protein
MYNAKAEGMPDAGALVAPLRQSGSLQLAAATIEVQARNARGAVQPQELAVDKCQLILHLPQACGDVQDIVHGLASLNVGLIREAQHPRWPVRIDCHVHLRLRAKANSVSHAYCDCKINSINVHYLFGKL